MSSAICFILDQSKILSSGNGLIWLSEVNKRQNKKLFFKAILQLQQCLQKLPPLPVSGVKMFNKQQNRRLV